MDSIDLEAQPNVAAELCLSAQARVLSSVERLSDHEVAEPSALPSWSRAHVITHLARNADGHRRRLNGALAGVDTPRYANGSLQRNQEIEVGAHRSADELVTDLAQSQELLANTLRQCMEADWTNAEYMATDTYPVRGCPARRLRELEMHHVDLDTGYTPMDWPSIYVDWDLANLLNTVSNRMPERLQRQSFLAWLSGRGDIDPRWALRPWA
ncbi:maleylpyruvate isomerase family mycothiol-dependent enzyme [Kocuria sp. JC486]|uniref:maleylpyruvate isomerase N-terminal domain-containing protein n=1 Tax=Kocuria sp. JC486 TaxID=1970736 RepID=UPI0014216BB9|nr:maleylpyruvate isomerase N-terminal domain-containing protein [Kocuria sp. JC486]NHU84814.1 maleylpyruvate isomerase family mycothiol-dependent enzyme [Kocuria sp. JC486]